jgi:hypothetical protein
MHSAEQNSAELQRLHLVVVGEEHAEQRSWAAINPNREGPKRRKGKKKIIARFF